MNEFTKVHSRKNTRSVKWDAIQSVFQSDDVLPMWVADMDFRAPEAVNEALIKRAEHGIYGYTTIDDDVNSSVMNWLRKRHNWEIQKEWLSYSPGVVPSIQMAIQACSKPGDGILIQTPVYTPFYRAVEVLNRKLIKNPLIYDNHTYSIDFEDFEKKLQQDVKIFVLCSPHNPIGRVWKRDELTEIARLCLKYNVLIISDEIHCDLIYPGNKHIPIASLSDAISQQTITCMAPSKTFNLAGLQASYIVIKNKSIRKKVTDAFEKQGFHMINTMGNIAMEVAYKEGEPWLEQLISVITKHKEYVISELESKTSLRVVQPEGTYLLWIDCSSLQLKTDELQRFMVEQAKVGLNAGLAYGEEGMQFMRLNIACPMDTLQEGIQRIIRAVNTNK
ncbi:MalY/PatB family protein [Virgibacillus soli]|uniref:cysteine-S-conjugate beta-lyase n=1 Tax=Paracerasibacillus soli TaxID=480284 RepID=A0ABU5CQW1_9BACI|nr:PatB family C-S lyase [Virgibacillus soli]MDY0408768.1 PatB family C-S lyase [Virgibacillus soli]